MYLLFEFWSIHGTSLNTIINRWGILKRQSTRLADANAMPIAGTMMLTTGAYVQEKRSALNLWLRLLRPLSLVRPQLPAAVLLPAETPHRVRLDRRPGLLRAGVVIKGQLGHRRDITQGEEGEVVQLRVGVRVRHGEHAAIRVA